MTDISYTVVNSAVVTREKQVEVDGSVGILSIRRLHVELVPDSGIGGTLALDLLPDTEGFAIGDVYTATLTLATPAAPAAPADPAPAKE